MEQMYLHPDLQTSAEQAGHWLRTLFTSLCRRPDAMPRYYRGLIDTEGLERTVCDYIAGMTDRFCVATARQFSTL